MIFLSLSSSSSLRGTRLLQKSNLESTNFVIIKRFALSLNLPLTLCDGPSCSESLGDTPYSKYLMSPQKPLKSL